MDRVVGFVVQSVGKSRSSCLSVVFPVDVGASIGIVALRCVVAVTIDMVSSGVRVGLLRISWPGPDLRPISRVLESMFLDR